MNIYNTMNDLPLHNFIKIVVYGDLNWLYKSKPIKLFTKKNNNHLKDIWDKIFAEYTKRSGSPANAHVFSLLKELVTIEYKLLIIQNAIDYLSKYYNNDDSSKEIINLLISYGFRFSFTEETLEKDLVRTASSAKNLVLQKQAAEKEYNEIIDTSGGNIDEAQFIKLIAQLGKFMNFKIDAKYTTVTEYLSYISMYDSQFKKHPKSL